MITGQSLLELISIQMGCALSDLHCLSEPQRQYLAQKLEPLTPRKEDLDEWNDALGHLTNTPPETSASMAKIRLIQQLLQPTEKSGTDQLGKKEELR